MENNPRLSHDGGTASTYGAPPDGLEIIKFPPGPASEARVIVLFDKPDYLGYAGTCHVGRVNASPHVAKAWLGL